MSDQDREQGDAPDRWSRLTDRAKVAEARAERAERSLAECKEALRKIGYDGKWGGTPLRIKNIARDVLERLDRGVS